ncbi:MAG: SUMF1/EgtB/PvdO family nonheme iron enzyme, partial [Planctomycetes bacterium]|nr:SUMF1/EgtB/PvdO family nonheme iron enzyme [Planctomycetota bacterium]
VWGLGAILYEVLTGSPPFEGESLQAVLGKARRGEVVPPGRRAPGRAVPRELEAACLKALAPRKEDRFASARELHDALQAYIEGIHDAERRAAEAARLLERADALRGALRRAEERAAALEREEDALRSRLPDHAPEEEKRPLWGLAERAAAAREEASSAFGEATAAYLAVTSIDGANVRAREALAGIYLERLRAAEETGDRQAAAFYEQLVRQHHGGRYAVELEGEGLLRLETDPPGARVTLSRYEERGPLLVETPPEPIGATPLERRLPRGSYLLVLERPGSEDVRYPFLLERCARHEERVRLPAAGSIPEGFVYVPGGPTIVGGDAKQLQCLPRRRAVVKDLVVGRFPVTFGEYCELLNEEFREERPDVEEHLPFFGAQRYLQRAPDGRFVPVPKLDPRLPVLALTVDAPLAYCRWRGRKLGKPVRLLEEVEWERCARGADGRTYPWGNGFDWAFCKGAPSRKGEPAPEPVGVFSHDASPFGVRDLGGGVKDLCAGTYAEGYRPLRGGSWFNHVPFVCRTDFRTFRREGTRTTDAGFRVCYDGP